MNVPTHGNSLIGQAQKQSEGVRRWFSTEHVGV
jgi:hypothetical protein